jgi:glycosyltransferase involved in cell wall biosynthesis
LISQEDLLNVDFILFSIRHWNLAGGLQVHIGMIYGEPRHYPPDIRVDKEIKALCSEGHRITILAQRIPINTPEFEQLFDDCAFVKRVVVAPIPSFLSRQKKKVTLVDPGWIKAINNFVVELNPDILHVHDFTLLPTTLKAAEKYDVPVVADLHENMPAALQVYRLAKPLLSRLIDAVSKNYYLWRWHESQTLRRCCKVIVVVPEAVERVQKYGIPESNIVLVSNTEDEATFQVHPEEIDPDIAAVYQSKWVVSYIGGIGPHRGIDTVLRGVPLVNQEIPNLLVLIVGASEVAKEKLMAEIQRLGIEEFVDIIGWQHFEKVKSYTLISKACLVPHNNFEHTQTTVPHKLFQYMMAGRPVLVSNCRPLARIVNETKAGLVFEAGNETDFADKLIQLYNSPKLARAMGRNGSIAARGPYAWRHDANRLTNMYRELEQIL